MTIYNVSIVEGIKYFESVPPLISTILFPFIEFLFLSFFFILFFGLFINALYDVLLCKTKIGTLDKTGYKKLKLLTLLFFILMGLTIYLMYEFIYLPYGREIFMTYFHM